MKIPNFKSQVSSLKPQVSSLKSQVSSLKSQVSSLKSQVSSLKSQVSILIFLWITIISFLQAYAQPPEGTEYQVKAGFIYNFARYSKWPGKIEKNKTTINLCIISDDPYDDIQNLLNNKLVRGKKIRSRKCDKLICVKECCKEDTHADAPEQEDPDILSRIKSLPVKIMSKISPEKGSQNECIICNPHDPEACHILFVCSKDQDYIREILYTVKDRNILTIGEADGFTQMGGIINFFFKKDKKNKKHLRFKVSRCAARRARVKLSAPLLMSAEIVEETCK